jgi:hypothetical protein
MEEFGFHYTLQSNASLKMFPGNKPDSFTVQLAERMNLDENWVVGLAAFHYPLSVTSTDKIAENITVDDENDDDYDYDTDNSGSKLKTKRLKKAVGIEPLPGVFSRAKTSNGQDVQFITLEHTDYMKQIDEHRQKEFKWMQSRDSLTELLNKCESGVNDRIQALLQEQDKVFQEYEKKLEAKDRKHEQKLTAEKKMVSYWKDNFVSLAHMAYMDANQMNNVTIPKYLYVQCSIVKMEHMGDTFTPHLHVSRVPPIRMNGETWTDRCDFPYYKRLAHYSFDRIEIDIRNEQGHFVSFDNGVVIITLHFKRIPLK